MKDNSLNISICNCKKKTQQQLNNSRVIKARYTYVYRNSPYIISLKRKITESQI